MKKNLIDQAEFEVRAGDGGRGAISFRREKFVPKGGPDGGHGGDGGSIWLEADEDVATLKYFAGKDRFEAQSGQSGSKRKRSGEDAEDVVLQVPVGTVVWLSRDAYDLGRLMDLYGKDWQLEQLEYQRPVGVGSFEERWPSYAKATEGQARVDSETTSSSSYTSNVPKALVRGGEEWVVVGELTEDGQRMLIARGGQGGRGNSAFKSSRITTPWFAETGTGGERWRVRLELKVLADIGLVGLPNVGKSTLLSVMTAAKPEVADYPFTTLSPNLGVITPPDPPFKKEGESAMVVADIPGLIEKAHEGKGLGDAFLRHVERCQLLLYVVAPLFERGFEESMSGEAVAVHLWEQYATVREEVRLYRADLEVTPSMVVVNKLDLLAEEQVEAVEAFFEEKLSAKPLMVSAATSEGVGELKRVIGGGEIGRSTKSTKSIEG